MEIPQKKILIVDDDNLTAIATSTALRRLGYQTALCQTGEQAIALVESGSAGIDLLLLDFNLGNEMDGVECARQILSSHDLPVLFYSNETGSKIAERMASVESYGYIPKGTPALAMQPSIEMAFRLHEKAHQLSEHEAKLARLLDQQEEANADLDRQITRYRRLIENAPIILYSFSEKRGGFYVSGHVNEVFGYSPEHLAANPFLWNESIYPEDKALVTEAVRDFSLGKSFNIEYRIKNVRGETRWLQDRSVSRTVTQDDVVIEGMAVDITAQKQAIAELAASEERFRSLVNSSDDVIFTLDTDMRHTGIYGRWMERENMTTDTFLGKTAADIFGPEAGAPHMEANRRALAGENVIYDWETGAEDHKRYFQTSLSPIHNQQGSVIGVVGIGRNITSLKRAEQSLRESETRWTFALEGSGDGVWDWNAETNEVYFSDRWKELLGYRPEEIGNRLEEWQSRIHPDDLEVVQVDIQKCIAGETPVYSSEHRLRCKDGSYRWTLDRGKIVSRTPDGKLRRMIGTQSDISEQKRLQHDLQNERNFLRQIIDAMGEGLTVTNKNGDFELVNQAFAELLGYEPEALIGKRPPNVTLEKDLDSLEEGNQDRQAGKTTSYQSTLIHTDGHHVPVLVTGSPRWEDGQVSGSIATITNMTAIKKAEQFLRETREQLRQIIEQMPMPVEVCDPQGTATMINHAFLKTFGIPSAELVIGKYNIFHDAATMSGPKMAEAVQSVYAGKQVDTQLITLQTSKISPEYQPQKDENVDFEITMFPVFNSSRKLEHVVTIFKDVTLRNQMENELRTREREFKTLVENAPDVIVRFDRQHRHIYVNPVVEKEFGSIPAELLGKSHRELGQSLEMASWSEKIINEIFETGEEITFELENPSPDGPKYFLSRGVPEFGADGQVESALFIHHNITERKKIEKALQAEQGMRRAIEMSLASGITIVSKEGRQLYANPSFCRMVGWTEEELVGCTPPFHYWPEEELGNIQNAFGRTLNNHIPTEGYELVFKRKNGERFPVQLILSPFTDGEQQMGWLANVLDITERKRAEQELAQKNAQLEALIADKDKFFSIIAHDLKNPLISFITFADILNNIDEFDEEEFKTMTKEFHKSAENLMALLENLLAWARLQRGTLEYDPYSWPLRDMAEKSLELLQPNASQKDISIVNSIPREFEILADGEMVNTILRNLVSNAVKFTHPGGQVEISAQKSGSQIITSVRDNGMGIPTDYISTLFQIGAPSQVGTAGEKGTGLGLILCREFVEKNGGKIWVESQQGKGTTFHFSLAAAEAE
jgi:PAS domain S-box-containing protein